MKSILLVLSISLITFSTSLAQTEVTVYSNHGDFVIELYDSIMPITAGNFKSLVDTGFYDSVILHRIISGFVLQGGDPTGTGSGGPGYTIPDEFVAGVSNLVKTISMANAGPNTGGSQFFINMSNNTFLDFDKSPFTSAHPVFGIVTSGWTVCKTIEQVPVNGNDRPINDVRMDSVRVTGSTLSLEEINANRTVTSIYPNPISTESVLDIYTPFNTEVRIRIMSLNGKEVYNGTQPIKLGKTLLPMQDFNLDEQPVGTYILTVTNGNSIQNLKFTIVK